MTPHPPQPSDAIDAALADLHDLDHVPAAEHVTRFAALHDALTAALASIDEV